MIKAQIDIKKEVVINLLTCQKKAAEAGDTKGTIAMAKYLLKLVNNIKKDPFYIVMEESNGSTCDPPQTLHDDI